MWKSRKRLKIPKGGGGDGDDEKEDRIKYTSIKCGLRGIIRPKYRDTIIESIESKSILSTKICALVSILFLHEVQKSYDRGRIHCDYFQQDGTKIIKNCFYAVLHKNIHTSKMPNEFRMIVDRLHEVYPFDWPNNKGFGKKNASQNRQ